MGEYVLTVLQAWSSLSSVHTERLNVPMQGSCIWQAERLNAPDSTEQLCEVLQRAVPSPEGNSFTETGTP